MACLPSRPNNLVLPPLRGGDSGNAPFSHIHIIFLTLVPFPSLRRQGGGDSGKQKSMFVQFALEPLWKVRGEVGQR